MTETPTCRTCDFFKPYLLKDEPLQTGWCLFKVPFWIDASSQDSRHVNVDYGCSLHKPSNEHPQFKEKVNE